jgi:CBS domain-containing protein
MTAQRRHGIEDAGYVQRPGGRKRSFDATLLEEPLSALPLRRPIVFAASHNVSEAVRAMQAEHFGCVVVTEDGTTRSRLAGIFTERDVLLRIVGRGRNPATLPLGKVMTSAPDTLRESSPIASALHLMSIEGFQHLPVVDRDGRPAYVASVRDIVAFLVELFPREVLNCPLEDGPESPRTREGA